MSFHKIKKILPFILIIGAGFLIRLIYLSYTGYDTRTHDAVGGHITFVEFILKEQRLPPADACWECWQPPLYYISAAGFVRLFSPSSNLPLGNLLQIYSLFAGLGFIIYGVLVIRLLLKNRTAAITSSALITFWPSGIIHFARIGNDALFYLLTAASLYYAVLFSLHPGKRRYGLISLFFSLLSLLTKTNGIIMVGTVLLIYLFNLKRHPPDRYARMFAGILIAAVLLCGIQMILMKDVTVVHNASGLNNNLRVPVTLTSFIGFDAKRFITAPYTNPWENGMGREFFWEYLAKTALFGEFTYPETFNTILAMLINVFFIGAVFFWTGGAGFFLSRKDITGHIPLIIYVVLSFLLLVALRIKIPVAPSNDFRYIFPILIPFGYYFGRIIQVSYEKKATIIATVGVFLACGISVGSVLFFLSPLI